MRCTRSWSAPGRTAGTPTTRRTGPATTSSGRISDRPWPRSATTRGPGSCSSTGCGTSGSTVSSRRALAWPTGWRISGPHQLGPDHQQTLHLRFHIANVLRSQGRFSEALELDTYVLERQRAVLGPDHPHALMTAGGLGADLCALGALPGGAGIPDRGTYESFKEQFGEDYPRTLTAAHNLAVSLRLVGECFAARDLDQETLDRRRAVLGREPPVYPPLRGQPGPGHARGRCVPGLRRPAAQHPGPVPPCSATTCPRPCAPRPAWPSHCARRGSRSRRGTWPGTPTSATSGSTAATHPMRWPAG